MKAFHGKIKNQAANLTGYHLFFSEERARVIAKGGASPDKPFNKKQMQSITRKWRSFDIITRTEYDLRCQQEKKNALSSISPAPAQESSFTQKKMFDSRQETRTTNNCSPVVSHNERSQTVSPELTDDIETTKNWCSEACASAPVTDKLGYFHDPFEEVNFDCVFDAIKDTNNDLEYHGEIYDNCNLRDCAESLSLEKQQFSMFRTIDVLQTYNDGDLVEFLSAIFP